jgi:hypothetical protein
MIRAVRSIAVGFIMLMAALPARGNGSVELRIESVERSDSEVAFHILIENSGDTTVFLEEMTKAMKEPYGIRIEHSKQDSRWVFLGPQWDARPVGVFRLRPGDKIRSRVILANPYPDLRHVPVRSIPLVGRFRATVRYFRNEKEWARFEKTGSSRIPAVVTSQPVVLEAGGPR